MKINKDITDLILVYTTRYFSTEKSFYKINGIKMTDANWQRFKNGTTAIEKMPASRINNMLDELFTPFEQCLISQAQIQYYISNTYKFTMPFSVFYDMYKKQYLMNWLDTNENSVVAQIDRLIDGFGNYTTTVLHIWCENEAFNYDGLPLQLRFEHNCNSKVPAGKQNRLEWIKKNLEDIR